MKDYWDSSAVIEACNSSLLRDRLHRERGWRYEFLLPTRYNNGSSVEPERFFETQEELVAA